MQLRGEKLEGLCHQPAFKVYLISLFPFEGLHTGCKERSGSFPSVFWAVLRGSAGMSWLSLGDNWYALSSEALVAFDWLAPF